MLTDCLRCGHAGAATQFVTVAPGGNSFQVADLCDDFAVSAYHSWQVGTTEGCLTAVRVEIAPTGASDLQGHLDICHALDTRSACPRHRVTRVPELCMLLSTSCQSSFRICIVACLTVEAVQAIEAGAGLCCGGAAALNVQLDAAGALPLL